MSLWQYAVMSLQRKCEPGFTKQKQGGFSIVREKIATAVLIELMDKDEEQRGMRGKTRAWIRRRDENEGFLHEQMLEDTRFDVHGQTEHMRMLDEKCWPMLDENIDRNQTSSNIVKQVPKWCSNEDNMLCPTMFDDVVPKCCIHLNKLYGQGIFTKSVSG